MEYSNASREYVGTLLSHGFLISMASKVNPYDNAAAESFIKPLKTEEIYLWEYRTMADVQNGFPISSNRCTTKKSLHSSLGYKPPDEFEKMFQLTQKPENPCLVPLN